MCILQTCLDFLEEFNTTEKEKEESRQVEIFVVCDAVSSCRPYDRTVALQRLNNLPGVTLITAESAVFELLGSADHPQFRVISALMKALPPEAHAFGNDTALL